MSPRNLLRWSFGTPFCRGLSGAAEQIPRLRTTAGEICRRCHLCFGSGWHIEGVSISVRSIIGGSEGQKDQIRGSPSSPSSERSAIAIQGHFFSEARYGQEKIGLGLEHPPHCGIDCGRLKHLESIRKQSVPGFPSVRKWDTLSLRIAVGAVQVIARREDY